MAFNVSPLRMYGGLDPPNAEETRLLGIGVSSVIRAHLTATCTPLQRHLPPLTATPQNTLLLPPKPARSKGKTTQTTLPTTASSTFTKFCAKTRKITQKLRKTAQNHAKNRKNRTKFHHQWLLLLQLTPLWLRRGELA